MDMYSMLFQDNLFQCVRKQHGFRQLCKSVQNATCDEHHAVSDSKMVSGNDMNKCECVQHAVSDKCECLQHALTDKLV